jgi:hypothetical protein
MLSSVAYAVNHTEPFRQNAVDLILKIFLTR